MTAVTVPDTQIETRWIDLTNQHRFDELSDVEEVLGARDTVIRRTTSTATHTGGLRGVPATGRTVRYAGVGTCRVIDGKITEEWFNDDLSGLTQTINAAAAPGMDRS